MEFGDVQETLLFLDTLKSLEPTAEVAWGRLVKGTKGVLGTEMWCPWLGCPYSGMLGPKVIGKLLGPGAEGKCTPCMGDKGNIGHWGDTPFAKPMGEKWGKCAGYMCWVPRGKIICGMHKPALIDITYKEQSSRICRNW